MPKAGHSCYAVCARDCVCVCDCVGVHTTVWVCLCPCVARVCTHKHGSLEPSVPLNTITRVCMHEPVNQACHCLRVHTSGPGGAAPCPKHAGCLHWHQTTLENVASYSTVTGHPLCTGNRTHDSKIPTLQGLTWREEETHTPWTIRAADRGQAVLSALHTSRFTSSPFR